MTRPDAAPAATVLLVEQDEGTALPLMCSLERAGHRPELAVSGADALARLRMGGIALVVVDGELPDVDGAVLARRIRRERLAPAVILLTAGARRPRSAVPADAPALVCLAKPFSARELLARTRLLLRRTHAQLPDPRTGGVAEHRPGSSGSVAQVPQNVV